MGARLVGAQLVDNKWAWWFNRGAEGLVQGHAVAFGRKLDTGHIILHLTCAFEAQYPDHKRIFEDLHRDSGCMKSKPNEKRLEVHFGSEKGAPENAQYPSLTFTVVSDEEANHGNFLSPLTLEQMMTKMGELATL